MSIYATLWRLKFPRDGEAHSACQWIEVYAQGVPAHIGSPSPGSGYDAGDPYGSFLPPPVPSNTRNALRAVVIITEKTHKGTGRSSQEYVAPLMVLSGEEYAAMSFADLQKRICDALRGGRPRLIAEILTADGERQLLFEDGSVGD